MPDARPCLGFPMGLSSLDAEASAVPNLRSAALTLLAVLAIPQVASAHARQLDGATIVNSGSTNTAGWSIELRSDGSASVDSRAFSLPPNLTAKFFSDIAAARDAHAAGRACMKSVSFGTRLNVTWHEWTSPDLSCPAASPSLASLANDVTQIVQIAQPPSGFRRVRLPLEPHRAEPTPSP